MKLEEFKRITGNLKYNDRVTIKYRSNWQGGRLNEFQAKRRILPCENRWEADSTLEQKNAPQLPIHHQH